MLMSLLSPALLAKSTGGGAPRATQDRVDPIERGAQGML
jgi:hypothetical protein